MVQDFTQWRVYVEGAVHPVRVYTDHKNLEYFSTTRTTSRRHARWATTLSTYNYTIFYRKGVANRKLDALSRWPDYVPPPLPSLPIPSPNLPLLHTPTSSALASSTRSPPPRDRSSSGGECHHLCIHSQAAMGASRGVKPRTAQWQPLGHVRGSVLGRNVRIAS